MEYKLVKRLSCFLLAMVMMVAMAIPTFAQEYEEEGNREVTTNVGENVQEEVVTRAIGNPDSGTVKPLKNMTLHPTLNSYVGFQRTFTVTTIPMGDGIVSGAIIARLYDPDGNIMKTWELRPEEYGMETFFLPKSGTYRLEIYNGVSVDEFVTCTWTA